MSFAEFLITDGTDQVDFLRIFFVQEWRPIAPVYEQGGIYQRTPFADRSRLVHANFTNTTQTVQLALIDHSADALIVDLQDLRRLLVKAANYWTSDRFDEPVWVQVRMKGETATRYTLIVKGDLLQDGDPFSPKNFNMGVLSQSGLTLIFEHQLWHKEKPGTTKSIAVGTPQNYDQWEDSFIQPTNGDGNYLANRWDYETLTIHLAPDTNPATAAVSINGLWGVGTFPASAVALGLGGGAGECTYFVFSRPNTGFAVNLYDTYSGFGMTGWEYWNGVVWGALPEIADTSGRFTYGDGNTHIIGYNIPSDWASLTTTNFSGYAVRLNTTGGIAMGASFPKSGVQLPWIPATSFLDVALPYALNVFPENDVLGDIIARILLRLINAGEELGAQTSASYRYASKVLVAIRSFQGSFFPEGYTGFINAVQGENEAPTEMDINMPIADADATLSVTVIDSPVGRVFEWAPVAARAMNGPLLIKLLGTINEPYKGTHRIFTRVRQVGGVAADFNVTFNYSDDPDSSIYTTPSLGTFLLSLVDEWEVIELGVLDIMPNHYGADRSTWIGFFIDLECFNVAGGTLEFSDLWFVPTNEWHGEFKVGAGTGREPALSQTDAVRGALDIDSVTDPKVEIRAMITGFNSIDKSNSWVASAPRHAMLQPNTIQRIFVWWMNDFGVSDPNIAPRGAILEGSVQALEQYLLGIGDR